MKLHFDWDENEAAKNLKKHRVPFDEATTVFDDPMFVTFVDQEHSVGETRYITIGLSKPGRLLLVAHTDEQGHIRVISAQSDQEGGTILCPGRMTRATTNCVTNMTCQR